MYKFVWITIISLASRIMVEGKYVPCKATQCGKSSMQLVDEVRAPLYAELDTDSLNRQLKTYIDTNVELEISETLTNKTEVMDQKLEQMKIDMMTDITELKEEMQAINSKLNTLLNLDKERQDKLSTRNTGDEIAKDCKDLNPAEDGIYFIRPKGYLTSAKVYCETKTDGGGWTVFQRRSDGSVSFYKGWNDYEDGFGNLDGEHWLGNKLIHAITSQRNCELRIDLEDWEGDKRYATYSTFLVGDSGSKYNLTINGYDGNTVNNCSDTLLPVGASEVSCRHKIYISLTNHGFGFSVTKFNGMSFLFVGTTVTSTQLTDDLILSYMVKPSILNQNITHSTSEDDMKFHDGMKFSTKDQDNDQDIFKHCAQKSSRAWWYFKCYHSNLNGLYNDTSLWKSMSWNHWRGNSYSLKSTRMMIR